VSSLRPNLLVVFKNGRLTRLWMKKASLIQTQKPLQKKAKAEDICVPIGEGENCW
jgi:hypothetical protein